MTDIHGFTVDVEMYVDKLRRIERRCSPFCTSKRYAGAAAEERSESELPRARAVAPTAMTPASMDTWP